MNLYIFRHGQTYYSKNDLDYGDEVESAVILPEAKPIVEKLATHLKGIKTDVNYTSPFKRCLQTVEIVKEVTSKNFIIDKRLRDIDPRIEKLQDVIERTKDFSEELKGKNYDNVAICTHGWTIKILEQIFTTGEINFDEIQNYPKTGVLLAINDNITTYTDFNE